MIYDISNRLAKEDFESALQNTSHGDVIIYHVGEFAAGKHKHNALDACNGGFVELVQKKLGRSKFQYRAQRTKKKLLK